MTSATKMHAKLGQALSNGPRGLEEAEIPNAVPHRRSIPAQIDMIEVEDRLRSVDEAAVEHIAESMEARGQIYPVQIKTIEPGRFRLLTGAHRIAAARKLGWTHIEAFLVDDLDEEEATLLEIDENLCRAELDPVDRAHFFATRKEIYQRLYPETRSGGDRKSSEFRNNIRLPKRHSDQQDHDTPQARPPSFVDDTAASTRWSSRTIHLYTRIGEQLDPALREALSGTPIGRRRVDLERIADMDADKQQGLLKRLQDAERPPASLSALMMDPYRPSSPPKSNLDRLDLLWAKTSAKHRQEFLERRCAEATEAERKNLLEWLGAEHAEQPEADRR